jgi:hypothetical protein
MVRVGGFLIADAFWGGGISWTNSVIESFTVAPVPRNQVWRTIKVELRPMGYSYLTPLAGRERSIRRIIAEFEEYRDALASPGRAINHNGNTRFTPGSSEP